MVNGRDACFDAEAAAVARAMREWFATRHRARRAALLADLLREQWNGLGDEWAHLADVAGMDLPDAAAALSDQAWVNAADEIAQRTGEPFRPPSDITRQMTIGLLSAPNLRGLVH